MNIRNLLSLSLLLVLLCVAACSKSEPSPKIRLSTDVVFWKGHIQVHASGFTPKTDAHSHLKRPDGTEFPVLNILTDAKGEFDHDVDSLLLRPGTHELWVEDSTGVSSNVAKFEVTLEQAPLK